METLKDLRSNFAKTNGASLNHGSRRVLFQKERVVGEVERTTRRNLRKW